MPINTTTVGLGDKFVNSYPLKEIDSKDVKNVIKGVLNQALSCRVAITTTRKSCDQQLSFVDLESSQIIEASAPSGGARPAKVHPSESQQTPCELAIPLKKFERPTLGEMGYVINTSANLTSGRFCCGIIRIDAAPIPLARLRANADISTALGANGAMINFDAKARAELVGLNFPKECDLECGSDTIGGSVELVLDGTITASIAIGPFGAGVGFAIEGLRVPMGNFNLTCGKDVALT